MIRTLSSRASLFIAIGLSTVAGSVLVLPHEARANDCVVDTNHDGSANGTRFRQFRRRESRSRFFTIGLRS